MIEDILEIVNTILKNRGSKMVETIDESTSLRNDIGFDSLDLAELTVRLEAKFGIDVFEDGIVNTIGEIMRKLKA